MLLFPISEAHEANSAEEETAADGAELPKNVYFMKQTIGNACGKCRKLAIVDETLFHGVSYILSRSCEYLREYFNGLGTIGVIHAVANNTDSIKLSLYLYMCLCELRILKINYW